MEHRDAGDGGDDDRRPGVAADQRHHRRQLYRQYEHTGPAHGRVWHGGNERFVCKGASFAPATRGGYGPASDREDRSA